MAPDWAAAFRKIDPEIEDEIAKMGDFLREEISAGFRVLPAPDKIFRAFSRPLADVKVLIVGQDPYPTIGHPVGLSFSVAPNVRPLPASLQNIFRELADDMNENAQKLAVLAKMTVNSGDTPEREFDAKITERTDVDSTMNTKDINKKSTVKSAKSVETDAKSTTISQNVDLPKFAKNLKSTDRDVARSTTPGKFEMPENGDLSKWFERGVMLMNRCLTVRAGAPNSHQGKGWEKITEDAVKILAKRDQPLVAILWGRNARELKSLLAGNSRILIIESAHPSPLSARSGFFGSRPFSRTNEFLIGQGEAPINWRL